MTRKSGKAWLQVLASVSPYVLFGFMTPAVTVFGIARGGLWSVRALAYWLAIALILDLLLPAKRHRLTVPQAAKPVFKALTWITLPVVAGLLLYAVMKVTRPEPGLWRFVEIAVAVGFVTGPLGVTVAHELVHRKSAIERALGVALLSLALYAHFRIDHVYGHHRLVSDPEDPATSRRGEWFYPFLLRSLTGQFVAAWRFEGGRLRKRGLPAWHWRNPMLRYVAIEGALVMACWAATGRVGAAFFIAQAGVAVFILELVHYIQHYGLIRENGERVAPWHSWNSAHRITNWTLFNLGLHANHHLSVRAEYYDLAHESSACQMPVGYFGAMLLALVPPLWFRVMNPRIERRGATAQPDTGDMIST